MNAPAGLRPGTVTSSLVPAAGAASAVGTTPLTTAPFTDTDTSQDADEGGKRAGSTPRNETENARSAGLNRTTGSALGAPGMVGSSFFPDRPVSGTVGTITAVTVPPSPEADAPGVGTGTVPPVARPVGNPDSAPRPAVTSVNAATTRLGESFKATFPSRPSPGDVEQCGTATLEKPLGGLKHT